MDNAFIGAVMVWANDFEPKKWMFCHGQYIAINENTALFSLIGTLYGGDGITHFRLPDLRGRTVIGEGRGVGLLPLERGYNFGLEKVSVNLPRHNHSINLDGDVYFENTNLLVSADEADAELKGTYGVPISNSSDKALIIPNDTEHYLGETKLPRIDKIYTYHKSDNPPQITTKPTTITVTGKSTPTASISKLDDAILVPTSDTHVGYNGDDFATVSTIQPSLALNYIICVDGYYPSRS